MVVNIIMAYGDVGVPSLSGAWFAVRVASHVVLTCGCVFVSVVFGVAGVMVWVSFAAR